MACVFEETTRPVEKIPSWWMWHGTMGFRLVDRLLASNIDFLRGNNYHIFVARPDFLQEKRLVLNHGIAQWCLPILQAYHCCGRAAMKDQVLGASSLLGWQSCVTTSGTSRAALLWRPSSACSASRHWQHAICIRSTNNWRPGT